ncbi:hypothetical protein [Planococcus halotolerans]|uniref:Uncharacterized protein n=1 Tax=Planococcus halotolerans TaxID=2233542 RepID=A0A365KKH9_9BACL|nr:hypothetical protein [Planococcus halotolerans]RAZ73636.1 hypothetical protein DP120_17015 [Planococcus halotolerans]
MIKGLLKGKPAIQIDCVGCGFSYESRYIRGQLIKYSREFGEYENHTAEPCTNCGMGTVINLNLPEAELSEAFMEEMGMPEEERQQRRVIKDFKTEITFEER